LFQTAEVFETLKKNESDDLQEYKNAEKALEVLNLGLALNSEGEATSLQDQLRSKFFDILFRDEKLTSVTFSCKVCRR
jgi:hypothetical protein